MYRYTIVYGLYLDVFKVRIGGFESKVIKNIEKTEYTFYESLNRSISSSNKGF